MASRPPAVAVWGTFDVDNYGDHLFPLVARRELTARLRGARVDAFSPFGWLHPTPLDGGERVRPLGPRTASRLDGFASAYDAVVVGGGELLHLDDHLLANFYDVDPAEVELVTPSAWFLEGLGAEREATCPVLWHGLGVPYDFGGARAERVRGALGHRAWASVRDPLSEERLRAAGVSLELDVAPDSGILVDRLFAPDDLRRRAGRLRRAGVLPGRPALVLQGCDLLVPHVAAIAAALGPRLGEGEMEPVLVETGRCRADGRFADALAGHLREMLPGGVRRLPADAELADIVAVLGAAGAVVGSSLHGAVTAAAFRRPFVVLNLGGESKLEGFGLQTGFDKHVIDHVDDLEATLAAVSTQAPDDERVVALQAEADRHFDRMAELIGSGRGCQSEGVTTAHGTGTEGGRPMLAALDDDEVVRAHLARLRSRGRDASARAVAAEAEVRAVLATRTFRSTSAARSLYARLRRRLARQ